MGENPDWVASIVPVKKKNGQIRVCVDFRDLNKACPKDEFSLPVTEILIDHTHLVLRSILFHGRVRGLQPNCNG